MLTSVPRGTKDILPSEVDAWRYVEGILRDLCRCFGFKEIRTPVFEHTELFQRGIGDTTDVVEKEMYTFIDRGPRQAGSASSISLAWNCWEPRDLMRMRKLSCWPCRFYGSWG